jgi:hypothetical protein
MIQQMRQLVPFFTMLSSTSFRMFVKILKHSASCHFHNTALLHVAHICLGLVTYKHSLDSSIVYSIFSYRAMKCRSMSYGILRLIIKSVDL